MEDRERKSFYDNLMSSGFSDKYAKFYMKCIEEEKQNPLYNEEYGKWALEKGFLYSHACEYGLTESNYRNYLSDYDFYRLWPLNSWSRIWVDDKMTLKYMLNGTDFSSIMPKYYFYSTKNGLRELVDNPYKGQQDIETLITLIKDKGNIACKPNNGTGSNGFFRLSFENKHLAINGREILEHELIRFVENNPNYIFTEYLSPSEKFAKIHDKIHSLRIMTVNTRGNNPMIVDSWIRFGTDKHGEANMKSNNRDCITDFDVNAAVDIRNGHIHNAKRIFFNKSIDCCTHPDTGAMIDLYVPHWEEVVSLVDRLSRFFFNIEFMGYDFGITENGIKLMEINTHPGIRAGQVFRPYMLDKKFSLWLKEKLIQKQNSFNIRSSCQ